MLPVTIKVQDGRQPDVLFDHAGPVYVELSKQIIAAFCSIPVNTIWPNKSVIESHLIIRGKCKVWILFIKVFDVGFSNLGTAEHPEALCVQGPDLIIFNNLIP